MPVISGLGRQIADAREERKQAHRPMAATPAATPAATTGAYFVTQDLAGRRQIAEAREEKTASSPMATTPASTTTMARRWQRENRFLIDPRQSKFMRVWEPILLGALLFTSIVTPFEVRCAMWHTAESNRLSHTASCLCGCG